MASPYTSQSASGYNATPPTDDGSAVASNQVLWSTIKTKLNDPVKNLADNINSAISTAVGKMPGGASTSTQSTSYQVLSADQGKLIIATVSGITITTPDATSVSSPFQFRVLNNSDDTITVDGSSSQTIDGNASITVAAGAGVTLDTDGSDWYTNGIQGTLVGKQLQFGDLINGTITESNGSNAATFALKTLAGSDPSSSDPVIICFRNSTVGTGNYVYRTITAATSLVLSSGSTLGTTSSVAYKVWLVIFDDGGTLRLGAINCLSTTSIYPLGQVPLASSTAEGGAGAADSAHVFYTGTAVTSKAYAVLGYASYESGLATAGSWNASPTRIQLYGNGVPLPGQLVQEAYTAYNAADNGSATAVFDDTIPQVSESNIFMTQAITPTSKANLLDIEANGIVSYATDAINMIAGIWQDATASALAAVYELGKSADGHIMRLKHRMIAGTTSSTSLKYGAAGTSGAAMTFNGQTAARKLGGSMNSYISVKEIMT